jgi:hypothetical protein
VGVIADALTSLAKEKAKEEGMALRLAFTPTPVGGKTSEELAVYVNGKDPVTGLPLMEEIVGHLTRPLNAEEQKTGIHQRERQRTIGPDTYENLQKYFDDRFWSKMLPIILPTEEAVEEMLAGTSHKRDENLGRISVTGTRDAWSYTVETVAINAVMAGAKPEHFPALLAMVAAGGGPSSSSTSSMTGMAVFNGPIVDELELNFSTGAMGLFNKSGAVLGRAWDLVGANVPGGAVPGINYMGVQGNAMGAVPAVFAENEAGLPPGWKPLHVQKGFAANDSTVSTFGGCQSQSAMMVLQDDNWDWVLNRFIGALGVPNRERKTLFIDPAVTPPLLRLGFDTKEKLIDWVEANVTIPKKHYWLDQEVQNYKLGPARQGREPYASWLSAPDDAPIPFLRGVEIVVVGGSGNVRWSVNECGYGETVKVDDWR